MKNPSRLHNALCYISVLCAFLFLPITAICNPANNVESIKVSDELSSPEETCNDVYDLNELVPTLCGDVTISLSSTCSDVITAADLIDVTGCPLPITVTITNTNGTGAYGDVIDDNMIGGLFHYSVEDAIGQTCWDTLRVIDEQAPVFACPNNRRISCLEYEAREDTIVDLLAIDITECDDFMIFYTDSVVTRTSNCNSPNYRVIFREFFVEDASGNIDSCAHQLIRITRIATDNIILPSNTMESCTDYADLTPTITGLPEIDGEFYTPGDHCNINVSFIDQITSLCGAGIKITRTWTVTDLCEGVVIATGVQVIDVIDNVAAGFTPPADFTVNASNSDCTGDVILPSVVLSELCTGGLIDDTNTICITSPGLGVINTNGGTLTGVDPGVYIFTYTAKDACGNTNPQDVQVTVEDLTPPVALCKQTINIPIGPEGYVDIPAISFNSLSEDNCGHLYFKIVRMDTMGITCTTDDNPDLLSDDEIRLCCSDFMNTPIMAILQVFDIPVPTGPIDPEDPLYAGHYGECMVAINLQDKVGPVLVCPSNTTVECGVDLNAFADVALVHVYDNCNLDTVTVAIDSTNLTECNVGSVDIIFTGSDLVGNVSTCTQVVTVINSTPFDGSLITDLEYPADTTLYNCLADTMPVFTGFPIINDDECSMIFYNYADEVYTPGSACITIKRTWNVMDWCQFDSNADPADLYTAANGFWSDYQLIYIQDTIAPVVSQSGPSNFPITTAVCDPISFTLDQLIVDDCTDREDIDISFNVYDQETGALIFSGVDTVRATLDIGIYDVQYLVDDGCGNTTYYYDEIAIYDTKSPTLAVYSGIAVDLITMAVGEMVEVCATMFNKSSSDNCAATADLHFSFSADPTDTCRIFDCDNVGANAMTVFVFDGLGNYSSVNTTLTIQDNDELCPTLNVVRPTIAGRLTNNELTPIPNTSVQIMENESDMFDCVTDADGYYQLEELEEGSDYFISPKIEDQADDGLSTLDIIQIQKHILGLEELDNPYAILAADVNGSKSVTASDIILLRQLILGKISEFSENESWRFIDANYVFADNNNPFYDEKESGYAVNPLTEDMNVDFVAFKMGDINNSNSSSNFDKVEGRNNYQQDIVITNQELELYEETIIPVDFNQELPLEGFQVELTFGAEINFVAFDFAEGLVGDYNWNDGKLRISAVANNISESTILNSLGILKISSDEEKSLDQTIGLSSTFDSEIYLSDNSLETINLRFSEKEKIPENLFYLSNKPNPFTDETTISFLLEKAENVQIDILDLSGRLLRSLQSNGEKGLNEFIFDASHIDPGIYFYKVSTSSHSETKKMIVAK